MWLSSGKSTENMNVAEPVKCAVNLMELTSASGGIGRRAGFRCLCP